MTKAWAGTLQFNIQGVPSGRIRCQRLSAWQPEQNPKPGKVSTVQSARFKELAGASHYLM